MFLGLRGILDGSLLWLLGCFNDGLLDSDILGLLLDDDGLLLDEGARTAYLERPGMAIDLGPKGIRVNAVCAGTIRTPLTETLFQRFADITHGGDTGAYWRSEAALYPLGRVGEAHEVAELMYFLASDAASFMTGGLYLVDGGLTAG